MTQHFISAAHFDGKIPRDALLVALSSTSLLLKADLRTLPEYGELMWQIEAKQELLFLGYWDGRPVFTVEMPQATDPLEPYDWIELRQLLPQIDHAFFSIAARALQIHDWSRNHRFCGRCGGVMGAHPQNERARVCTQCGFSAYPRINPCVIGVVKRGHEILLARAHRFKNGMFSALAGFVEVGESAEETFIREVREEVGVEINNLRYFSSQAWPFPSNLMLGFVADYAGGELVLQDDEIAEAGFFHADNLPLIPPYGSIAHALIEFCLTENH
ncbi:MAG: NAD(+) diphosphatase [Moraxellaceae bacterium]|nr:NAD(+) diphosphatase [Moraxellaceae bacterium]MDZ4387256.1 NAD(+) diphosphatase [Moraxellaceae bacterium]